MRKFQAEINARLSDPSGRVREVAAAALEALREAWAEAPDPSELLRQGTLSIAGAASLLEMVSEGSFDPLLRALESNRSAKVLGEYFSAAGRGALGSLLASLHQFSETDAARARNALARVLREHGKAEALLAGLKSLRAEDRLEGVEVAGLLATPEAAAALVVVLEKDPVAEVRSRAATALGATGESSARAALAGPGPTITARRYASRPPVRSIKNSRIRTASRAERRRAGLAARPFPNSHLPPHRAGPGHREDQEKQEQHDKDPEDHLGDGRGHAGHPAEPEDRRNHGDNQE